MKKRCLFLIIFLFIFLSQLVGGQEDKHLVERVLAVVNNEVITQSEFDAVFRPIFEEINQKYQGADRNEQLQDVRIRLLNQMIEDRLVAIEAKRLGIEVSDAEVREEIDAFKSQFPDPAVFEEEMKKDGLTLSTIEKRFRERLAIEKLHQMVIRGQALVTPSEIEEYYKLHEKEFVTKPTMEAWIITVRKSDAAVRQGIADERAKSKIEGLRKELKTGKDFTALARAHSDDDRAEQGGFLGTVERGDLIEEFDAVLFSLGENRFSEIFETEISYHILKSGKSRPPKALGFEEVKDDIYDHLYRQKSHAKFVEWMDELKKKSHISVR